VALGLGVTLTTAINMSEVQTNTYCFVCYKGETLCDKECMNTKTHDCFQLGNGEVMVEACGMW